MKIHRYSVFVIFCMATGYFCDNYLEGKLPSNFASAIESFLKNPFNSRGDGFITIPENAAPQQDVVHIYVPRNASSEGKARAKVLIDKLKEENISYLESEKVRLNFPPETDRFLIQKIDVTILGETPVVIVNGKIKANPTPEQVIQQYKKEP